MKWLEFLSGFGAGEGSGFGIFAPRTYEDEKRNDSEDDFGSEDSDNGEFISLHELRKNRISREGTQCVVLQLKIFNFSHTDC